MMASSSHRNAVRTHVALVAGVTAAALLGAVAWLLVRPVVYSASAKLLVTPEYTDDASWLGLSVLRSNPAASLPVFDTAAAMIDSPGAAKQTARQLGRGWTAGQVSAVVTVTPDAEALKPDGASDVLDVTATEPTPRLASQVAETFARASILALQPALRRQATLRLRAARTYTAEQGYELRAVQAGADPMFSITGETPPRNASHGGPPLRMLGLSVLAGLVFGGAAALLFEAARRRGLGDDHAPPRASDAVSL